MDFYHILLLFHIGLGEFAGLCFLWVAADTFNRTDNGFKRVRIISPIGALSAVSAWIAGGLYYLNHYGPKVKPVIIAQTSTLKWAHSLVIETKEHIFLFIPALAIAAAILYLRAADWKSMGETTSRKAGLLSILIFLLCFLMAGLGALVSGSVRSLIGGGI